jgi:hypothetical protein
LLTALFSVAIGGAGTSYAEPASADPGYVGRPHMGLMDPAPNTVTPGTGGIKPVRPVKPIPRPKPKPRPVVDPNIIGYSADGTPIYPWGPRPQPPKPVKPEAEDEKSEAKGDADKPENSEGKPKPKKPLQPRIDELVAQHGSLRAVARVTEIDAGYLSRLRTGEKVNPEKDKLKRLGLRRVVTFERLKP